MKNVIFSVVFSLRLVYLHLWSQGHNLNKLGRGLLWSNECRTLFDTYYGNPTIN